MRSLYPVIEPYAVHHVGIEKSHEIYMEECGNPRGIPVVFLHGGPGSGCSQEHRRFFDPGFYRIILFDQRGSGRSQPLGETAENCTLDLISDMEVIRRRLDISQWMLFGGSWGATLSLLYAQSHPESVLGMVLRGTFLARQSDLEWFFVGLKRLFPQAWEELTKGIPDCEEGRDIIDWYYSALQTEDPAVSLGAARSWSGWGTLMVNWHTSGSGHNLEETPATQAQRERLLAKVGIETHYAHHRYFIGENEILSHIGSLPAIPVTIVHGRYDLTCTMESAWLLHKALPGSRLVQVPDAGHLIDEPAMISALIEETDRMRELL